MESYPFLNDNYSACRGRGVAASAVGKPALSCSWRQVEQSWSRQKNAYVAGIP